MRAGDFRAAWQLSDAIRARGLPDPHRFWHGEPLARACLIVRSLHGYGDAVQMLRYAPMLQQLAASVVYEVPPALLELAPCFPGVDNVITWGDQAPAHPPAFDVQVEIMELPYLFRTESAGLPVATRYLHLPQALLTRTASRIGSKAAPRIGLVWAAGEWNPTRSIPVVCLAPLLALPGVEFWNLQGGEARTQLTSLSQLIPDQTLITGPGIPALAATIAHLDLVITVDTLAAHLAGALGKPAWLLLEHTADWRWQTTRTDTPWYPTLRLFRQPTPGDWPGLIAQVRQALTEASPEHPL